jgi:repressor LexA
VEELSNRQQEILDLIGQTVRDRGYPPSVREIGDSLGLRSPSTVHSHLSTLVRLGYLRRDPTKPRAIEVVDRSEYPLRTSVPTRDVPLVGRIAAGSPILAEEDIDEVFPLPEQLVGSGPVIMLEVHGDSMIDAGILDGDYVVVRRQDDANDGEIVAALIEDEATVKRLERRSGRVILHSENPAYEPLVIDEGISLVGKVVSVLRAVR